MCHYDVFLSPLPRSIRENATFALLFFKKKRNRKETKPEGHFQCNMHNFFVPKREWRRNEFEKLRIERIKASQERCFYHYKITLYELEMLSKVLLSELFILFCTEMLWIICHAFLKKNEQFRGIQPDFRSKSKFLIDFNFALFKTIFDSIENYSFVILTKTIRPPIMHPLIHRIHSYKGWSASLFYYNMRDLLWTFYIERLFVSKFKSQNQMWKG